MQGEKKGGGRGGVRKVSSTQGGKYHKRENKGEKEGHGEEPRGTMSQLGPATSSKKPGIMRRPKTQPGVPEKKKKRKSES